MSLEHITVCASPFSCFFFDARLYIYIYIYIYIYMCVCVLGIGTAATRNSLASWGVKIIKTHKDK